MVRIGKTVEFTGSRENIAKVLVKGLEKLGLSGVNFSFVNDTTMNIYGEGADLTTLRTEAIDRGYTFTIIGNAPAEPTGEIEPQPTADEIQALVELKQAFNKVIEDERTRIWNLIEAEYNRTKTTSEPFRRFTDFKHLRQKA